MGNPQMSDDGLALRVMGRVRPLLGEIALCGTQKASLHGKMPPRGQVKFVDEQQQRAWIAAAVRSAEGARTEPSPHQLSSIVDWIEGATASDRLRPALERRRRVILIDAVCHDASPGHVQHWHLEQRQKSRLNLVRFYQPAPHEIFDHLPFWLEEEVPEHGTDLIAIEPYRIEPGTELTPVIRSRLSAITSQVGGLLLRILEEEGWRFDRPGPRRTQKRPRVA
jgi:hydrogenase maturation protease